MRACKLRTPRRWLGGHFAVRRARNTDSIRVADVKARRENLCRMEISHENRNETAPHAEVRLPARYANAGRARDACVVNSAMYDPLMVEQPCSHLNSMRNFQFEDDSVEIVDGFIITVVFFFFLIRHFIVIYRAQVDI